LSKNTIRLQYSGFIIFAAQLTSIITGLAFTLLLSRNMTQQQYGIWANIFDLTGYFLLLSGLFPFWTMRFVARRKEGAAKTGLLANLAVSLASTTIYILLTPTLTRAFNISGQYVTMYLIASAQIINLHLIVMLESILRAKKPQAIGYGLIIEEITKITMAYILIVRLQQLFLGALLSLIAGIIVQTIYYLTLTAGDLKQEVQWTFAKEWLKGSTANLYNAIGTQLAASPIILLFLLGGQAARGNYQAATTFSNMIGYALFLSYAMYPKLLAENTTKDVTSSLKTVLMFAIPMTAIVLSIPDSLLTILRVDYNQATSILLLLTIDAFILLMSQFITSVILGIEKLDEEATIPLRKLARSKIFKIFTLPYLQAAISIPTSLYVLSQFAIGEPVLAAIYVTIINLVVHATTLLIQYAIMHASLPIKMPWKNIGKYVLAATPTAVVLHLLPDVTTLALTVAEVVVGAAIYLTILLTIDPEARKIINEIWSELKHLEKGNGLTDRLLIRK
jgi:O-antigen/teichoic acid export membrane protein